MTTMNCITIPVLVLLILLECGSHQQPTIDWLKVFVKKFFWHNIRKCGTLEIRLEGDQVEEKIRHRGTWGHDSMDSTSMPLCSINSLMWLPWFLGSEELSGNNKVGIIRWVLGIEYEALLFRRSRSDAFWCFLHALSLDKPEVENFQRSKYVKQCVRTAN